MTDTNIIPFPIRPGIDKDLAEGKRRDTWFTKIHQDLAELSKLERNWDGYDGIATQPAIDQFVRTLLACVYFDGLLDPFLAPGNDGTLQIEWIYGENELLINVAGSYEVQIWRNVTTSPKNGEYLDLPSADDFGPVRAWLKEFVASVEAAREKSKKAVA